MYFVSPGHVGPPLPCNSVKLVDVAEMNYLAANGEGEVRRCFSTNQTHAWIRKCIYLCSQKQEIQAQIFYLLLLVV